MSKTTRNELIKVAVLAAAVAIGFFFAQTAFGAERWYPTQADLDTAIANAAKEWGTSPIDTISIRLEKAPACGIVRAEDRESVPHDGYENDLSRGVAITNYIQYKEVYIQDADEGVTSTVTYAGGTSEVFDKKSERDEETAPTVSGSWVIRINATCAFWTPYILSRFVLHEYGHTLSLKHSSNDRDIMYWVVFLPAAEKKFGTQSITPEDRAMVKALNASAGGH
jgi:Matrixin